MPLRIGVVAGLLLTLLGNAFGGFYGEFQGSLSDHLKGQIAVNPALHGLSGDGSKDQEVVRRAVGNFRSRLMRFHFHAGAIGLIVLIVSLVIANTNLRRRTQVLLTWTVSLAGFAYPFGWLLTGLSIGPLGFERATRLGWYVLAPSGGLFVVSTALVLGAFIRDGLTGRSRA
jgi:hypothetical protein